jgi:hypothetical protein
MKQQLSAEGVALLDAALEKATTSRNPTAATGVKYAVRRICADAKRNGWTPEQLLVAFKSALATIPAVQRLTRGPDRDQFVARLVSVCIDEYYAGLENVPGAIATQSLSETWNAEPRA